MAVIKCWAACRSSKITVIESLPNKADKVILGGGMIFTFYKARGIDVGASLVEERTLASKARKKMAAEKGVQLIPLLTSSPTSSRHPMPRRCACCREHPRGGWMGSTSALTRSR
jgi:phosphoglycerate kinase